MKETKFDDTYCLKKLKTKRMNKIKRCFLNDKCILYLIVANALVIFLQEFTLERNILDYLEPIFTILFIIEMVIKIKVYGFSKYISDNWNKLDFALVIISMPSLAAIIYDGSITQFNIFLTLRAFRVFKFFRLVRFFPNIESLVVSIKRALKASYIILFGFVLLIFMISIVTCSLYKNIVPEYFSNPLDSFYSIFRIFSVDGWNEIPDLIATRSSPVIAFFSKLYFVILLFAGGILGLSLVNSIFVDAMVSDNNDDLQNEVSELIKKIDALTEKIDKLNNTHQISNT